MSKYTTAQCIKAFCACMNAKAGEIGMSSSRFYDPCGINNYSTAKDMMRCLLQASGYEKLYDIWNRRSHTIQIKGRAPRELTVISTVTAADDSPYLTDHYRIMGGKTGTLTYRGAYNLVTLVEVPGTEDWLVCAVLYASQPNGSPHNRFAAAKQAIDAALIKYYDRNADNSDAVVCASGVAVCRKPGNNPRAYAQLDVPMLFKKNATEEKMPASASKIMTAMIVLDFVSDLNTNILVTEEDIQAIPSYFYAGDLKAGDIVTVKDALYALFLPSSNSSAYILSRFVGEKILKEVLL